MTTEELKKLKQETENEILEALKHFQLMTGMCVDTVEYINYKYDIANMPKVTLKIT